METVPTKKGFHGRPICLATPSEGFALLLYLYPFLGLYLYLFLRLASPS